MESNINKRLIAKNTFMLYVRMILVMAVTLFTTRIVLKNLGVEDYGIYNVVGGVVIMLSFLSSSMAGTTQRFMSFELGINDNKSLNLVYCQSVIIHIIIATVILSLAETIGLWFVYNKLTIPEERFDAAMWVYQFAIISFIFQILNVPDQAAIITHEKMNVYAWVGILDVFFKLIIAYLISISDYDKLVTYGFLIMLTSVAMFVFYRVYAKQNFKECTFRWFFEKRKFNEMFFFAGWNLIGDMAFTLRMQGSNILLNMFFGPAVNAARGIAHQVDGAVEQFVNNFQIASNPQIVKSYAQQEYNENMKLVCQSSKFSFYLIIIITLPIIFQVEYLLSIWLSEVPVYTAIFIQLIFLNGIIDSVSKPLKTYIKATGEIKWYMIIQGGFYLLALPFIYLFLKLGYSPVSSVIVLVVFTFLGTFLRLFYVKICGKEFSTKLFVKNVLFMTTGVGIISYGLCCLYSSYFVTDSICGLLINSIVYLSIISISIWLIGLNRGERAFFLSMVKKIRNKNER